MVCAAWAPACIANAVETLDGASATATGGSGEWAPNAYGCAHPKAVDADSKGCRSNMDLARTERVAPDAAVTAWRTFFSRR